ncbi:MAG: hypothetical protein F6K28_18910, partial [Microcoleus sp. SIO2G3]|nr:hypothetical protein [Microcoleus sp. SIO2G3]
ILLPWLLIVVDVWFSAQEKTLLVAFLGLGVSVIGIIKFAGVVWS